MVVVGLFGTTGAAAEPATAVGCPAVVVNSKSWTPGVPDACPVTLLATGGVAAVYCLLIAWLACISVRTWAVLPAAAVG